MSSLLAHHRPFLADDAPLRAHSFEPFDQTDDSLYTSPPVPRDTYAHDQPADDPSAYAPHNNTLIQPSLDTSGGLYSQPDSLAFRGTLEFTSNNNPFQTSTAFSSASRNRQQQQQQQAPSTSSSSGALSHQSSLSALYGPDVPPFRSGVSSDLFALPPQQGPLDHQQGLLHQSSRLPLPNGFADNGAGGYDPYEFEPTPRGIRHQPSFGNGASRGGVVVNGSSSSTANVIVNNGNGSGELVGGPLQQAPTAAPLYVSNGGTSTTASSYATTTTGPTLRETLRDAREPRDSSVDARGLGRDRDGGGAGANGPGGQQEEISTIFVVGFPDDMQEREFQNMFTFSRGFEAATLKIPNKDSTAYNGAGGGAGVGGGAANPSLNASTSNNSTMTSASSASNTSAASSNERDRERRGTLIGGTAPGGAGSAYGGASDPYNLVTVNSGGVVVDSRDLPGGTQTSAVWPSSLSASTELVPPPPNSAGAQLPTSASASSVTTQQGQVQNQNQAPRKQIIGFAKFATRADALHARDVLQSKRVDIEKAAVLKAEMAKKNLHTKRGVGPGGAGAGPAGPGGPGGSGGIGSGTGTGAGASVSTRDGSGPATTLFPALSNPSIIGGPNGTGNPLTALNLQGAGAGVGGGSIVNDLHASYALSVREREQAALSALGVHQAPPRVNGNGNGNGDRDFFASEDQHLRSSQHQHPQTLYTYNHHHLQRNHPTSQSQSSASASSSSFSPESAPAAARGGINFGAGGGQEEDEIHVHLRRMQHGNAGLGAIGDPNGNASGNGGTASTPLANAGPGGWPDFDRDHEREREREHDYHMHQHQYHQQHYQHGLGDTEGQGHLEQVREEDDQSQSRVSSPPLSVSAFHPHDHVHDREGGERNGAGEQRQAEHEREHEHLEEHSFDQGVGDATLIAAERHEEREEHQHQQEHERGPEGQQEHGGYDNDQQQQRQQYQEMTGQRAPSRPSSSSAHRSPPLQGEQQQVHSNPSSAGPALSIFPEEPEHEHEHAYDNNAAHEHESGNQDSWLPRSASVLSASSRSGRGSAAGFSYDQHQFQPPQQQQQQYAPPQSHQFPYHDQQHQQQQQYQHQQEHSIGSTSSRESGSPPEMNGAPIGMMPNRYEEDERDHLSALHQHQQHHQGFPGPLQHLPLSHLPRHHQLGQISFGPRMQDMDRGLRFNESIFDVQNGNGNGGIGPHDLGGLESRLNDFSFGGGGGILRETTTSPLASPPLQSASARGGGGGRNDGSGGPGGHDSRANIDQNPPINTLYVGNLPTTSSSSTTNVLLEENLRLAFARCPGYRKLCFRQKSNGPMCFVEFEDVQHAAKALNEMYGHTLNGLIKNGIRLSYSKNPLGVRSPSMSNGTGVGMNGGSGFHGLHEGSGRLGSVDGGRFGSNKGSFFVENSAPPRRQQQQQQQREEMADRFGGPFDGGMIGPRTTRHMSLGAGGLGSLGDFANGHHGLGAVPEHAFGGLSGLSNGSFLPPTTSPPPPRLPPRYFSPDAIGGGRTALSPILSHPGAAPSAFGSLSGLGGYGHSDMMPTQQQQQPQPQQQAPARSSFSPFRSDLFGFDDRDRFDRNDSISGHFLNNIHDTGLSTTLYNSNTFAPPGNNGSNESR